MTGARGIYGREGERFDVRAMGHNSVEYLHTFAEATKPGEPIGAPGFSLAV